MSSTTICRQWSLPEDFWLPLCTNKFEPEEGLAACPVCVTPIQLQTSNVCGCPGGLTDGIRTFRLSVNAGINGFYQRYREFYGDFTLTNFGGTSCDSVYPFLTPGLYFGNRWVISGTSPPTTTSGKLWRIGTLSLYQFRRSEIVNWNIDPLPACNNKSSYTSGADSRGTGFNDWFRITINP